MFGKGSVPQLIARPDEPGQPNQQNRRQGDDDPAHCGPDHAVTPKLPAKYLDIRSLSILNAVFCVPSGAILSKVQLPTEWGIFLKV
jgi:hypothetical protein